MSNPLFWDPVLYQKELARKQKLIASTIYDQSKIKAYVDGEIDEEQLEQEMIDKQSKPVVDALSTISRKLGEEAFEKDKKVDRSLIATITSISSGIQAINEEIVKGHDPKHVVDKEDIKAGFASVVTTLNELTKNVENTNPQQLAELLNNIGNFASGLQEIDKNNNGRLASIDKSVAIIADKLESLQNLAEKVKDKRNEGISMSNDDDDDDDDEDERTETLEMRRQFLGVKAEELREIEEKIAEQESMAQSALSPPTDLEELYKQKVQLEKDIAKYGEEMVDEDGELKLKVVDSSARKTKGKSKNKQKVAVPPPVPNNTPVKPIVIRPATRSQKSKDALVKAQEPTLREQLAEKVASRRQAVAGTGKRDRSIKTVRVGRNANGLTPAQFLEAQKTNVKPNLGTGSAHPLPKAKQPYSIYQSWFGNLKVDKDALHRNKRVVVHDGAKKVMDRAVDESTFMLLTQPYNGRKVYSDLAWDTYTRLLAMSDLNLTATKGGTRVSKVRDKAIAMREKKTGSGVVSGSGIKLYKNDAELKERLKVLEGARSTGNNNKQILEEESEIKEVLNKARAKN